MNKKLNLGGSNRCLIYHIAMAKEMLIDVIDTKGTDCVLAGWDGTKEEAIEAVRSHPHDFIAFGDCDNGR